MKRVVFISALSTFAFAAGPVITDLQPHGAERGKPFTLTVVGRDVGDSARLWSTMPATFTPVVKQDSTAPRMAMMDGTGSATFLVEPKSDLTPGIYPVRIETPGGISNVLMFSIGAFPELAEEESRPYSPPNRNDSVENAEPLPSGPITVNGTLRGPERDVFRVSGKAGERRIFEVEARRAGSAIDPVIRVLDGTGKQLAVSEDTPGLGLDARLDFTFPREGFFYVEVHDARFSRQAQNHYRLKIGQYSYAESVFPIGGQRGKTVDVTFQGGNLAAALKASVNLQNIPAHHGFTTLAAPNSPTLPFLFAVSDLPELLEPADVVNAPAVINGRLSKPGEIDRYRIGTKPGDHLLLEVQARELGTSKLEAILTAYDPNGKKLDSAGDKPLPEDVFAVQGTSRTSSDPFLNLTVPAGVNEITVGIEDLAERGGPGYPYRIIVRRKAEDFYLTMTSPFVNIPPGGAAIVNVIADRRGFNGPIQISIPDLPKGIHAEGGIIPREYVDSNNARTFNRRGVLVLTAEPGVEMTPRELVVYGEGKAEDGTMIRQRARGPAFSIDVNGDTAQGVVDRQRSLTASWLGFDLPSALAPVPNALLEVRQVKLTRMAEGDRYDFEYTWKVRGQSQLPNQLTVDVIGAKDIRATAFQKSGEGGSFSISTTRATDPATYDIIIRGVAKIDGRDQEVYAKRLPLVVKEHEVQNASVGSR